MFRSPRRRRLITTVHHGSLWLPRTAWTPITHIHTPHTLPHEYIRPKDWSVPIWTSPTPRLLGSVYLARSELWHILWLFYCNRTLFNRFLCIHISDPFRQSITRHPQHLKISFFDITANFVRQKGSTNRLPLVLSYPLLPLSVTNCTPHDLLLKGLPFSLLTINSSTSLSPPVTVFLFQGVKTTVFFSSGSPFLPDPFMESMAHALGVSTNCLESSSLKNGWWTVSTGP